MNVEDDQEKEKLLVNDWKVNDWKDEDLEGKNVVDFNAKEEDSRKQKLLIISFLLMMFIGLGNKIFNPLMFQPTGDDPKNQAQNMGPYAFFVSLWTTFVYIPVSFLYIWPNIFFCPGKMISNEERKTPQLTFMIMGLLDSIAGLMQTFATPWIQPALLILLQQTAIPFSMIISYFFLKTRYKPYHYVGALIVLVGIAVVLIYQFLNPPSDTDSNQKKATPVMLAVWIVVYITSNIPMAFSNVYKEKALGSVEMDPVYLNGYVAIYQFLWTIPLSIPAAYASDLNIKTMWPNLWNGAKCYVGVPHDQCPTPPIFVNCYLVFNIGYNILIIMILKYGSANLLFLAFTLMVPLSFVFFSISKKIPGYKAFSWFNLVGLVIILCGLIIYRFYSVIVGLFHKSEKKEKT